MSLAEPIIHNNKILVSYTNKSNIITCHNKSVDMPSSLAVPMVNLDNPISKYHSWFDKHGNRGIEVFVNLRNKRVVSEHAYRTDKNTPIPLEKITTKKEKIESSFTNDVKDLDNDVKDLDNDVKDLDDNITQIEIDNTFYILSLLNWRDKDEGILHPKQLKKIPSNSLTVFKNTMYKLANDLGNAISKTTGALDAMTADEKNNFLYHVIAKGETMYYQSITDPEFCLYMLDQYQPLYSYMLNYD